MHPRAFQLLRGVSMQPFFSPDEPAGGGDDPPPAPAPAAGADDPPASGADDPPAGGGGDEPPAPAAGQDAPPGEPPPPPKRTDWKQGRIDKLTAQQREAQERADAAEKRAKDAEERAAAYEALYGKPDGAPAPAAAAAPAGGYPVNDKGERLYTQAELDAQSRVNAETTRLNEKLETMFEDGEKAHGDSWKSRVSEAGQAFGPELQKRPDFFQALTKLPNAIDVYHQLAGDLDHMNEVLAMGPVDLGMELAKLSTAAAAKPKGAGVSKVPAPITPIEAVSDSEVDLAKADMQTYSSVRQAQMEARHAARYR